MNWWNDYSVLPVDGDVYGCALDWMSEKSNAMRWRNKRDLQLLSLICSFQERVACFVELNVLYCLCYYYSCGIRGDWLRVFFRHFSLLSVTLIHEQLILHVAKRNTLIAVDSSYSLECMFHSYCYTRVICPASWEYAMQFILECLKKDVSCCDYCDIRAMDHCCTWLLCRYSIDVVIVHLFIFNSIPCCLCDVLMKGILLLKRFWLCCVGDVFRSIQSPSPKWQRVWMEYAAWWSEEGCCGDADGLLS